MLQTGVSSMGRLCLSLVNLLQTLFSLWGSWVRFLADLGSNKAFLLKSVKVLVMGSLGVFEKLLEPREEASCPWPTFVLV